MLTRRGGHEDAMGKRTEIGAEVDGRLEDEDVFCLGCNAHVAQVGCVESLHAIRAHHDAHRTPYDTHERRRPELAQHAFHHLAATKHSAVTKRHHIKLAYKRFVPRTTAAERAAKAATHANRVCPCCCGGVVKDGDHARCVCAHKRVEHANRIA